MKRGGGQRGISIDLPAAEGRYGREPAHDLTADRLFERRWALDLLGLVLARLEGEAVEAGKGELFRRLRPMLEGDDRSESYTEVGLALGLSEGAVKMAAHRLRSRYRDVLREEVGRTVADPAEVDAELVRPDQLACRFINSTAMFRPSTTGSWPETGEIEKAYIARGP